MSSARRFCMPWKQLVCGRRGSSVGSSGVAGTRIGDMHGMYSKIWAVRGQWCAWFRCCRCGKTTEGACKVAHCKGDDELLARGRVAGIKSMPRNILVLWGDRGKVVLGPDKSRCRVMLCRSFDPPIT
jgi:hypothetical protein